jgi:hypothetical protein
LTCTVAHLCIRSVMLRHGSAGVWARANMIVKYEGDNVAAPSAGPSDARTH